MKKLLVLALVLTATMLSTGAFATIDWAGNAYPNNGHVAVPTGDQFVVAQVYKGGVTDGPGQGADLSAVIEYQTDLMGVPAQVAMAYNTDIGNNDEYLGNIPQAALAGASTMSVNVIFTDATDASTFGITGDQAGNPAPLTYSISDVLPVDMEVGFRLCLSGAVTSGTVCVIGNNAGIGSWSAGVVMDNGGSGDYYGVTVTIPAGSSPQLFYKYQKDGCSTWEGTPDRSILLPTDGTLSYVIPDVDSWENMPIGCGLGNVLDEDKILCFQVCLAGTTSTGPPCVVGNIPELTGWASGVPMTNLGGDLWQVCVTIPAGSAMPIPVEYKYRKDGCTTWEGVANRLLTIDNSTPTNPTYTDVWDNGVNACGPIAIDPSTFGTLKARY